MESFVQSQVIKEILDSAEELFATHGYQGASLRNITKKAGVNLAAAHYHLGDKEELYTLVFTRRLRPINEERLACLAQAEQMAGGEKVPLPRLIEIMAGPLFELAADTTGGGRHFARLLGRSLADPLPFMEALLAREFQPATARFGQAVRRHVPNLAPEEFLWRLSFVIGAMHHTLATLYGMGKLTRGICRNDDPAGALRHFIPFAVAAFTVPPAAVVAPQDP